MAGSVEELGGGNGLWGADAARPGPHGVGMLLKARISAMVRWPGILFDCGKGDMDATELPDLSLASAFKAKPWGPHEPALQRLVDRMRWEPMAGKYVVVCTKPHTEWVLARLPGQRGNPIEVIEDQVFDSLKAAEWAVFKRRWERLTGRALDID